MREKRLACFFVHQTIDNPNDPNDPRVEKQLLDYDARGNLTHIEREINNPGMPMDTSSESVQRLVWDEEDRLLAVDLRPESDRGQPHIAAYTYDASGERGIRYVPRQQEGVSSGATSGYAQDMDIMLYPNALITVRPQELPEDFDPMRMDPEHTFTTYTKHYYIGSERINSKLGTVKDLGVLCEQIGGNDLIDEMNTRAMDAGERLEDLHTDLDKDLRLNSPYPYSPEHQFVCDFKSHNPELYDAYWYHPDHLGSSSYITNTSGEISQHMEYLPFGETLVEEHLNSYNSPFKFNGKEYDAETGNYYYGARYMNPKWSMWLGVDPLYHLVFDKTPYHYVSNNPINRVDPDGLTDYEVNKQGEIINTIENKKADNFFIVDDDGNRIEGQSISFKHGTIKSVRNPSVKVRNSKTREINDKTLTLFEIKGDENAIHLFEFLADPSNTEVEWTHAKIGAENSGRNVVGTSNEESSTPVGHYLRATGYTLREVNHNHPKGSPPSGRQPGAKSGDIPNAALYHKNNSKTILNVYIHPGNYIEYDATGILNKEKK